MGCRILSLTKEKVIKMMINKIDKDNFLLNFY